MILCLNLWIPVSYFIQSIYTSSDIGIMSKKFEYRFFSLWCVLFCHGRMARFSFEELNQAYEILDYERTRWWHFSFVTNFSLPSIYLNIESNHNSYQKITIFLKSKICDPIICLMHDRKDDSDFLVREILIGPNIVFYFW